MNICDTYTEQEMKYGGGKKDENLLTRIEIIQTEYLGTSFCIPL